MDDHPSETLDSILGGRLRLFQPRHGYRFSIDAILLGRFVRARASDRVLELGAGCGVVSIMIAARERVREVVAIELQAEMARLIDRNAKLNGVANLCAICADLRTRKIAGIAPAGFDLVVANPPYRAHRTGRESPNLSRRAARGAGGASLEDFLHAARRYAKHGGRVALVFTAARAAELIADLRTLTLEPKRIRFVHPRGDEPAAMILVEARKGGGIGTEIEPPLMLYESAGVYTAEAKLLLSAQ